MTDKKATKEDQNAPEELPRGKIIFYCKACKEIVDAQRIGKKYQYKCPTCKSTEVAFGTEMSIRSVYKIRQVENTPASS